jgi:quercetin dioxygenase-like cupin family protein
MGDDQRLSYFNREMETFTFMLRTSRISTWLAFAATACACSITPALAAEPTPIPPISRTVLEHHPIADTDQTMEIIQVTLQPGASAPVHHHPVPGLVYILEGSAESAYGNDAPKRYRAGDTMQDLPNVPHTVFRNPDPHKVLRFLVFANLPAGQAYTVVP